MSMVIIENMEIEYIVQVPATSQELFGLPHEDH